MSNELLTDILREKFLNFFKDRGHKIMPADSLVPKDDPTVLFTPAGMNQFKKEFLGESKSSLKRVATCQRCLRTDDLDKVGKTSGHHTFFEMLGNFSFGDYFKKEAIEWAWDFLTKDLNIKEEKLWVSVYREDEEAYDIWHNYIKLPKEKIVRLGDKENFWPSEAKTKGPNGPCGPCSEIFFDWGPEAGCKKIDCNPSCGCGRFVEVWNLVFTQFNRKDQGILEPLPKKNIDTGMGLERLTAVMEGVKSNFQTSLFRPIIKEILTSFPHINNDSLIYAISDHIRAIVFAIYDGVLPSNEERGYVVRKLIRKSTFSLYNLKIKKPFLYRLVPVVAEIMKNYYPELRQQQEEIAQIILSEEKNFLNTLNKSKKLFEDKFQSLFNKPDPVLAGRISFYLYDTYGIPFELSKDWLQSKNLEVSEEEFHKALEEQKNKVKEKSKMKGDVFATSLGSAISKVKKTKFLGYQRDKTTAKILKIIKDQIEVDRIKEGESAQIILDKTVFYPESGGQIADIGIIKRQENLFEVEDVQIQEGVIIHKGRVKSGIFKINNMVNLQIDTKRRLSIARNHTATHLLQASLRQVLGTHVKQEGSLVAEDRLRFDFSHFKALNSEELNRVEELVNQYILSDIKVETRNMTLVQAKKKGALAFFKEKYQDYVRVISIGDVSCELCGGTHLKSTSQIGLFKIIQESSIASGIRRIEATTGEFAYKLVKQKEELLKEIINITSVNPQNLIAEIDEKFKRMKKLEKENLRLKLENIEEKIDKIISKAELIGRVKLVKNIWQDLEVNLLREAVDIAKKKLSEAVICFVSVIAEKVFLVLGITEDLVQRGLNADKIIKEMVTFIDGSGGGRENFAQAGGKDAKGLENSFHKLKEILIKL